MIDRGPSQDPWGIPLGG